MCSPDRIAEPSERGTVIRPPSRSLAGAKQRILPFSPHVAGTLLRALASCKTTVSVWLCRHVPDAASLALRQLQLVAKAPHACCQAPDSTEQESPTALPVSVFVQRNRQPFLCLFRACRACPLPDKPHSRLQMPRYSSYGKRAWSHGASRPSRLAISRQVPGNPCPRPARATRSWRPLPAPRARCAGTRNPSWHHASA